MKHLRWSGALVLLFALLAGCQTPGPVSTQPEAAPADLDVAEKAEKAGEFVVAAREYDRLAQAAKPPLKQHYQLRAAAALLKANQARDARRLLNDIQVAGLDPSFLVRRRTIEAQILSLEGSHEKALRLLDDVQQRTRALNPTLLAEIYNVRAHAEFALDNPFGAVRNLIHREQYIVGKDAVAENQTRLWKLLDGQPRARLKTELNIARDPVLAGWIELAMITVDNAGDPARMTGAITEWKKTYPAHPAGADLLTGLISAGPGLTGRIERVALLLPLTSDYAVAAQAVREGFLAMDGANSAADKPRVTVYDTGADAVQVPAVYTQAVMEGAQLIIGPLGRDAAETMARAGITVPTLLLSHVDNDPEGAAARNLFQFGLPPEQEARQAAERAYLDGHRHAALLFPKTAWGERMQNAFTSYWLRLGGLVLAAESYNEEEADHSEAIKRLLNITQSEARKDLIEKLAGQKIQFDSRPRRDIDFIFLAADARRGRMLKPQLNFYHASRIPVYATSNVFSGKNDPVHDIDLDGIMFPDMPWLLAGGGRVQALREKLQHNWPYAHSDLDRLYALGVDAYAIVPHLNRISTDPAARYDGVTSALSLGPGGRLHRQLTWAQFSRGVPRLVDTGAQLRGQSEIDGSGG